MMSQAKTPVVCTPQSVSMTRSGMQRRQVGEVGAIHAVDGNAPAAGDEALDFVRRRRFAATGELGQQLVDTDDQDARLPSTGLAGLAVPPRPATAFRRAGRRLWPRPGTPLIEVAARCGNVQVVGLGEAQLVRQFLDVGAGLPGAAIPGDDAAPFGQGFFQRQVGEPRAHLDPRALGVDVAERRLSQSRDGPPTLAVTISTSCPVSSAVLSGTSWPPTFGAPAAVAEIGMHAVGEIDRRRTGRQIDDLALRRDDIDGFVERRLLFVVLDPVRTVGDFVLPGQQLAQPGDLSS